MPRNGFPLWYNLQFHTSHTLLTGHIPYEWYDSTIAHIWPSWSSFFLSMTWVLLCMDKCCMIDSDNLLLIWGHSASEFKGKNWDKSIGLEKNLKHQMRENQIFWPPPIWKKTIDSRYTVVYYSLTNGTNGDAWDAWCILITLSKRKSPWDLPSHQT